MWCYMTVDNHYFYIYNRYQAKFYIDEGLKVLEIGKGSHGDIYHKFLRDDESEAVFDKWKAGKGKYVYNGGFCDDWEC